MIRVCGIRRHGPLVDAHAKNRMFIRTHIVIHPHAIDHSAGHDPWSGPELRVVMPDRFIHPISYYRVLPAAYQKTAPPIDVMI